MELVRKIDFPYQNISFNRARTERAREARARGVAVAELGESARAAL